MQESPAVALFLALGIIIIASRLGGYLARMLGQPRVLGELIIGVLLGPTLFDLLHMPIFHGFQAELETTITELAEFGVLLLMFLIGLEVNLNELKQVGGVGIFAGILGALVPVGLTYGVMTAFSFGWQQSLFAGVTLAATSVSISAQVLLELGFLQTKVGNALLATALIDDVLAILLVSITVAVLSGSSSGEAENAQGVVGIVLIVIRMFAYIGIAFIIAWYGLPRLMNALSNIAGIEQSYGLTAIAIVMALLFGWMAEEFGGVAVITGSFIAGVGLSQARERVRHEVEEGVSYIAYALLVPVFFINVGLETNLRQFSMSAIPITAALLFIAILSKVVGCGFGARLGGFNNGEAFRLGVCMISRGEVGLIIVSIGLSTGVLRSGEPLFGAIFMVILLTTLVTPILVRLVFPSKNSESGSMLNKQALEG